jgi:hypothetical protein
MKTNEIVVLYIERDRTKMNEIMVFCNEPNRIRLNEFHNDLLLLGARWFDSIFKSLSFFLPDRRTSNLRNASIWAYRFLAGI